MADALARKQITVQNQSTWETTLKTIYFPNVEKIVKVKQQR